LGLTLNFGILDEFNRKNELSTQKQIKLRSRLISVFLAVNHMKRKYCTSRILDSKLDLGLLTIAQTNRCSILRSHPSHCPPIIDHKTLHNSNYFTNKRFY